MQNTHLGRQSRIPARYEPAVLEAIPRQREALGIGSELPFSGCDIWRAFELTWLDETGKPRIAVATIRVPAATPNLVESKSLKLYLGSLAMERFAHDADLCDVLSRDLGDAAGGEVSVELQHPDEAAAIDRLDGVLLDGLDIEACYDGIRTGDLSSAGAAVQESLCTHLFRSLCPVTGQPDSASVCIRYTGPAIDRAGLLRYLVSFRNHQDFHEACVERMFVDIRRQCRTGTLAVHALFNRRGGIDISPFRTDGDETCRALRLWRQ